LAAGAPGEADSANNGAILFSAAADVLKIYQNHINRRGEPGGVREEETLVMLQRLCKIGILSMAMVLGAGQAYALTESDQAWVTKMENGRKSFPLPPQAPFFVLNN
jgi:hypothetical protein